MNEDFARRLARLEAKNTVVPTDSAAQISQNRRKSSKGPTGPAGVGSTPGRLKLILGAVAVLVLLPGTAVLGTVFYTKNKDAIDNIAQGINLLNVASVGNTDDPEIIQARQDMTGIGYQSSFGTMTREQGQYRASDEGEVRLIETSRQTVTFDKLNAPAQTQFISD
jgi:hypothetical protein